MTYQFKIKLKGISKPPVWRRILIPANATFFDLHKAIQGAFGWQECHLFRFSEKEYGGRINISEPQEDDFIMGREVQDAKGITLGQMFGEECKQMIYLYDFGDGWVHDISLENIVDDNTARAVCVAGKGTCPPEDCGGPMGYEQMKEVFRTTPRGKDANFYRRWLGFKRNDVWDAEYFNLTETNEYMEEIYGDRERLLCSIPSEVIKDIADWLECGMICFLNPETFECEHIMGDSWLEPDTSWEREVRNKVNGWKQFIRIEPMESFESFKVMRSFIESGYFERDLQMKSRLLDVISLPKPFQHFKHLVETSDYRQSWFDYRHRAMEEYVKERIRFS